MRSLACERSWKEKNGILIEAWVRVRLNQNGTGEDDKKSVKIPMSNKADAISAANGTLGTVHVENVNGYRQVGITERIEEIDD